MYVYWSDCGFTFRALGVQSGAVYVETQYGWAKLLYTDGWFNS